MKTKYLIFAATLLLFSCNREEPVPDPDNTVYYTETEEQLANPERGFYVQEYYESTNMTSIFLLILLPTPERIIILHSFYIPTI